MFLLLMFSNCKSEAEPKYEDYDPEEFSMVPGIVTKITRTPIVGGRGHWYEYNVYYAYNLDSDTVLVGREMDVDIVVREGRGINIFVHKDDKSISFIAGARILSSQKKVLYDYLKKSKEKGVKYYGIEEQ